MGLGIVYGMAWRARNGIWHSIVYDMAWRARNGVWYGLVGTA